MNQRDIVWIRFPFSSSDQTKARPALVVSNSDSNVAQDDVLLCAITSNPDPDPHKVPVGNADLAEGALPFESMIRCDKLLQVEQSLVEHRLAQLSKPSYESVVNRIHRLIQPPAEST